MISTERVMRYKQRQQQSGRKLVTIYLRPDTIKQLRTLAGRKPRGEVVEQAISEQWRVSINGGVTINDRS